jgi:hypothetical protein
MDAVGDEILDGGEVKRKNRIFREREGEPFQDRGNENVTISGIATNRFHND